MSTWRPLEANEPIGVVALSGPVDPDRLAAGLNVLRSWDRPVELASNLMARQSYLAGDDRSRLDGLTELLDRGVRTFVAARGGYGVTRLMKRLPWNRLVDQGIRFVGFSDLTALLNPLSASVVQIHGPMVAAGLSRPSNARRLKDVLEGRLLGRPVAEFPESSVLRHGHSRGVVVGGNLSLMVSLLGTPWEPDFTDRVVFLEEVSEPPYRLDRMLTHLRDSVSFSRVKALICGSLHACRPHAECASRWADLLLENTPQGVPVVVDLPFGHGARNLAFPIGARVEVETRRGAVIWST
jgi:muramoyltetrapeptide carboxypeptidase